jgi:hypothetical protein
MGVPVAQLPDGNFIDAQGNIVDQAGNIISQSNNFDQFGNPIPQVAAAANGGGLRNQLNSNEAKVAGIAGAAGLLGGLFGGHNRDNDIERMKGFNEESLSSGMGFGGELGQLGQRFTNGQFDQMNRGQQGVLDTFFNPENYNRMRTGVMSNFGNAMQGAISGMPMGAMGGGQTAGRMFNLLRQNQGGLSNSLTGIGQQQLNDRRAGFGAMNQFATNRFNMGMGLRNQGFGIANNARNLSINNLMRLKQMQIQQQQAKQAATNAALGAVGTAVSGGAF